MMKYCNMLCLVMYEFEAGPRDTFNLTVSNVALLLIVAATLLYALFAVVSELLRQARKRRREKEITGNLSNLLSGLGVTMQDGGEKKKGKKRRWNFQYSPVCAPVPVQLLMPPRASNYWTIPKLGLKKS